MSLLLNQVHLIPNFLTVNKGFNCETDKQNAERLSQDKDLRSVKTKLNTQ